MKCRIRSLHSIMFDFLTPQLWDLFVWLVIISAVIAAAIRFYRDMASGPIEDVSAFEEGQDAPE